MLEDRLGPLLDLAWRVRHQEPRQRGPKIYSLHAPRRIGRGKARVPEFGGYAGHRAKGRAVLAACQGTGRQILTTVMQSVSSSPTSKSLHGLPSAASTATRAIAVTTVPTGSRSLSAARSGIPPTPFAARCDAELPWNP